MLSYPPSPSLNLFLKSSTLSLESGLAPDLAVTGFDSRDRVGYRAKTLALTRDLPFDIRQLGWTRVADSDGRRGHSLAAVHIKQIS